MDEKIFYGVLTESGQWVSTDIYNSLDEALDNYLLRLDKFYKNAREFKVTISKFKLTSECDYEPIYNVVKFILIAEYPPIIKIEAEYDDRVKLKCESHHRRIYVDCYKNHEKVYEMMKKEIDSWESIPELN